jgi:hypothetical protein
VEIIDSFGFKAVSFPFFIGIFLGLIISVFICVFAHSNNIFKRTNKFHNLVVKLFYPFILIVVTFWLGILFVVVSMKLNIGRELDNREDRIINLSVESTLRAATEINLATKGVPFGPEFVEHVANVITKIIYADFMGYLRTNRPLNDLFRPLEYKMTLESEKFVNLGLQNSLSKLSAIFPDDLNLAVREETVSLMDRGHLFDLAQDEAAYFFNILFLKVLGFGLLLLAPIILESIFYAYAIKRWVKKPAPGPSVQSLLQMILKDLKNIKGPPKNTP